MRRHIARLAPARQVPPFVIRERVEAGTADHDLDPRIHRGDEQRVVAAQGNAHATDAPAVDLAQRLEQVDRPHVIPDSLHRSAGVAQGGRVGLILAQQRVVGRDGHVTALGQLQGIARVVGPQAGGPPAAAAGPVQAQHGGRSTPQPTGDQQISGNAIARAGRVADLLPRDRGQRLRLEHLDRQGGLAAARRQRAHHKLHVGQDLLPPYLPGGKIVHRMDLSPGVLPDQQVHFVLVERRPGQWRRLASLGWRRRKLPQRRRQDHGERNQADTAGA